MPDFARGDVVAIVAAHLLGPNGQRSPAAISAAIQDAIRVVTAAHEATAPKGSGTQSMHISPSSQSIAPPGKGGAKPGRRRP
jgi:hypothetical protein